MTLLKISFGDHKYIRFDTNLIISKLRMVCYVRALKKKMLETEVKQKLIGKILPENNIYYNIQFFSENKI